MSDPYEQAARSRRNPQIQNLADIVAEMAGIDYDFIASSEHPYTCRCTKCLSWWASMGPDGEPDDEGAWGPFSKEEIEAHYKSIHKEV